MTNQPGQGRKHRPTALVGIEGGKRRPNEPQPGNATVRMPRGMTVRAKEQWRKLAPDLIAKGVLTAWDVDLFMLYCESWSFWEQARRLIADEGPLIPGAHGNKVTHPAVRIQRDAVEQIRRLGAQFGLSPSDRAGLSVVRPIRNGLAKFVDTPTTGLSEFL
jgi:P27 family predicted phage terminase small subunit